MKPTSTLLFALIAGAAAGLLWQADRIRRMEDELRRAGAVLSPAGSTTKVPSAEEDVSVKALEQEINRLRQQLGAVLRRETERAAASATNTSLMTDSWGASPLLNQDETNTVQAGLTRLIGGAATLSFEAQVARGRERLGLDDKQEQSMRDAVTRALERGTGDLERVLSGKARPDEVPTQEEWAYALEQEILSGLTPEQQALYRQYKREDVTAYSRLAAQGELLALQGTLGLSTDQQDQMFAVIFEQTLNRLDSQPGQDPQRPRDPIEAARYDCDQRLEALKPVLASGQIESYARLQNVYLQYWEDLLRRPATP